MFKVKNKDTGEIVQVLDTYLDLGYQKTWFLIWNAGGWRWYPADKYVPPNYTENG